MKNEVFEIRTDLAIENREQVVEDGNKLDGVEIEEEFNEEIDVRTTKVIILNAQGEKTLGKPEGTYITMEIPSVEDIHADTHNMISDYIGYHLRDMMEELGLEEIKALIVGLGNRSITSDALGPGVVEKTLVSRHMFFIDNHEELTKDLSDISAIAPGVMGQTGIETGEIIKAIVQETKPNLVIAIDALASRRASRINRAIQISNTGIVPGSGMGNHRQEITEKSMGVPVLAIGIPTVVDAATIVSDTFSTMLHILRTNAGTKVTADVLEKFSEEEKYQLVKELMEPELSDMFVTPKDIDITMDALINIVSEGINKAVHNLSIS